MSRAAAIAPVLLLRGNHDIEEDIAAFRYIHGVTVVIDPGVYTVGPFTIAAIPWQDRTALQIGPCDDHETYARNVRAAWKSLIWSLKEQLPENGLIAAHLGVSNVIVDGDERTYGGSLDIQQADLPPNPMALGHIHRHQAVGRAVYAGSTYARTQGEKHPHGVIIWNLDGGEWSWEFRQLCDETLLQERVVVWCEAESRDQAKAEAEESNPGAEVIVKTLHHRVGLDVPLENEARLEWMMRRTGRDLGRLDILKEKLHDLELEE